MLYFSGTTFYKGDRSQLGLVEYLSFAIRNFTTVLACWVINGVFIRRENFSRHRYLGFVLSMCLTIVVVKMLDFSYQYVLPDTVFADSHQGKSFSQNFRENIFSVFLLSIFTYGMFYSLNANDELQRSSLKIEMLAKAHLNAQLISLQQQISPHFLFNSLSTLKTIATDQPTKKYVVQLASVYRYLLNFRDQYLISVQEEMQFINSYLYIQKERFGNGLIVDIDLPEHSLTLCIPSLSLQIILENAIKHNRISEQEPLRIKIYTLQESVLVVENNFQHRINKVESTGLGIRNITERYLLMGHSGVEVYQDESVFRIKIPLLLK